MKLLVRKAELLIQRDRRREALDLLRRAAKIDPSSDEVHMLSVSAMLGILRDNPSGEPELVKQLDSMIDQPNQRAEFLALLIRGAIDNERVVDAVDGLIKLSTLLTNENLLGSAADEILNDIGRQCSLDSWVAARMREVFDLAGDEQQQQITDQVAQHMSTLVTGSTNLLGRSLRHFGFVGSDAARTELGQRLRDDGELLRLERLALGPSNATPTDIQRLPDESLVLLAQALGRRSARRRCLERFAGP